jgi:hypothetical protein
MVYAENEGEVFLGRSVTKTTNMSKRRCSKVDAEVRRIIDEQYAIARKLIEDNKDKMHAMAKALLEWETIDAEQVDDIMNGKPPRPPKDWTPSPRKPAARAAGQPDGAPATRLTHADVHDGASAPFSVDRDRHELADRPLPHRPGTAARDGHRQRHARFVLRRRRHASAGALAHCERAVAEGADILDIGGESTARAPPVRSTRSWRACCRCAQARHARLPVSVDTSQARVMRPRSSSAPTSSTTCARCAAGRGERWPRTRGGVCLMHMQGEPRRCRRRRVRRRVPRWRAFLRERPRRGRAAASRDASCWIRATASASPRPQPDALFAST